MGMVPTTSGDENVAWAYCDDMIKSKIFSEEFSGENSNRRRQKMNCDYIRQKDELKYRFSGRCGC